MLHVRPKGILNSVLLAVGLGRSRGVRFVPQLETADCGAAALNMVLSFHGIDVHSAEVSARCGVSRDGANALSILECAREHGLEAEGVHLPVEELPALPLPAMLHLRRGHFVVLERCFVDRFDVLDPAVGPVTYSREQLSTEFSGVALVFGSSELPRQSRRLLRPPWRDVGVLIAPIKWRLAGAVGLAATSVFASLVTPLMLRTAMDGAFAPVGPQSTTIALVAGAAIGILFGTFVRAVLLPRWGANVDGLMLLRMGRALTTLKLSFFETRAVGDVVDRIVGARAIRNLVSTHGVSLVVDGGSVLLLSSWVLYLSPFIGVCLSVWLLLMCCVVFKSQEVLRRCSSTETLLRSTEISFAYDSITMLETYPRIGNAAVSEKWKSLTATRMHAGAMRCDAQVRQSGAVECLRTLGIGVMSSIVAHGHCQGQLSPGTAAALLLLCVDVSSRLNAVFGAWEGLRDSELMLHRANDLLHASRRSPPAEWRPSLAPARRFVRLSGDGIGHQYGRTAVLEAVCLAARVHERLAVVGPPGSGKSTLGRILAGLELPTRGRVFLDDAVATPEDLRRVVQMLPQDPMMFDDTIWNNLTLGRQLHQADVAEALRIAQLGHLQDSLPLGLETRTGPSRLVLSFGERQRLCVARALLQKPAVLLMDESTSGLDDETQIGLVNALQQLPIIQIWITHRADLAASCERSITLQPFALAPH
jgi:ATP-binding cassette, subfamily B, bacterial